MKTVSYIIRGVDGDRHYINGELVKPEPKVEEVVDEREALKAILKEHGVPFGGNTSTAKLKEMVDSLAL
jgi:hypothetical protein